ncbi:MAG: helix-hairpin-helix domain-containing protein [Bacteroidales bacterium]|nr:helix-hairpin-helix domain-containing protein [Bacteroidales bacterium]
MSFFSNYFRFTRKERNGILFLITLNILGWTFYSFFDVIFTYHELSEYNHFEQALKEFYRQKDSLEASSITQQSVSNQQGIYDTCYVEINSPTFELLNCIGLSEKLARTWINYVSKGGKFYSIEDIKKLWGMNDSIFNTIRSHLTCNINRPLQQNQPQRPAAHSVKMEMVELNTADTTMLISLPGIGSSFANRIVKYRQRLGGFVSKEQLKEIYGITNELYDKINPYLYVDIFEVKKVNINLADYVTLIQHPYLNKDMVKAILNYRKKYGKINSSQDLISNHILSENDWEKLKWYVEF